MSEKKYLSTKEVAEKLGIKEVTVRKYSMELESKGYIFEKNEKNWRLFRNEDMQAFSYLQALQLQGKTVSESAQKVAELQQSNLVYRSPDMTIQVKTSQDDIKDQMLQFIEQQQNFNKELINRLEQQNKYINEKLEKRDHKLMQTLNELQEQKKLEQRKKSWQFWKK